MILIGQYDSPSSAASQSRGGSTGLPFEHRRWPTFGDADKLAAFNPLRRTPALDGGEALIESTAIPDYLDELVGPESDDRGARAGSPISELQRSFFRTTPASPATAKIRADRR